MKIVMIKYFISIRYMIIAILLLLTATGGGCSAPAAQEQMNGFDLSNASIDKTEILSGGPGRDGIPSIDNPEFIPINEVDFLLDEDMVIGFVRGDIARAYPLRILVWHEIVNDSIDDDTIAVTYCPLCGTAMVFDRNISGKTRTFGVSGLLYRSDVLMYDRETESLWSQLGMRAVSGPSVGKKLRWLPSEQLTWKAWREKYPHGVVLSTETGHRRDYSGEAYAAYFASDEPMFPVPERRTELEDKALVIGVVINGKAKAYPVDLLPSGKSIQDRVGNTKIVVRYEEENKYAKVIGPEGRQIPSVQSFWFAWQAFYPETSLWEP